MSANLPIRFKADTLRSIAFGAIVGSYMPVGSAMTHPIRQFKIDNLTDALLVFSFDGINDHFVVPSNGFFLDDITSNKSTVSGGFFLAQGDRLYVKQLGVPSTGSVYFATFFGYE